MVKVSYQQKPYRLALMETYGARVVASPSNQTQAGREILAQHPNSNGSLGIAISEAVEVAAADEQTKYALGSVLNHVLLHQTVIGQEALTQLERPPNPLNMTFFSKRYLFRMPKINAAIALFYICNSTLTFSLPLLYPVLRTANTRALQ